MYTRGRKNLKLAMQSAIEECVEETNINSHDTRIPHDVTCAQSVSSYHNADLLTSGVSDEATYSSDTVKVSKISNEEGLHQSATEMFSFNTTYPKDYIGSLEIVI